MDRRREPLGAFRFQVVQAGGLDGAPHAAEVWQARQRRRGVAFPPVLARRAFLALAGPSYRKRDCLLAAENLQSEFLTRKNRISNLVELRQVLDSFVVGIDNDVA